MIPARQNGSSIMSGKINPVIPKVVSQVAYLIIDMTIRSRWQPKPDSAKNILKKVLESQQRYVHISDMQSLLRLQKSLKTGISVKELVLEEGLLKEEELKEILKPENDDTAYERKSDESSIIINTIRIQKRMKSKKRLWRNSELLLLQYPLAQDIIHK